MEGFEACEELAVGDLLNCSPAMCMSRTSSAVYERRYKDIDHICGHNLVCAAGTFCCEEGDTRH